MFFIPFILVACKKVVVRSDIFKIDVAVSVACFPVNAASKPVILLIANAGICASVQVVGTPDKALYAPLNNVGLLRILVIPDTAVQSLLTCAAGIVGLLRILVIPDTAVQSLLTCAAGIVGLLLKSV